MKRCTLLLLTLFAVSLCVKSLADQEYTVTVTEVSVWVKAVDGSGKFVSQLTANDFEIYENDHPVSITCFEELSTPFSAEAGAPSSPGQSASGDSNPIFNQKFVLFLDLYNTPSTDFLVIKPKLQQFFSQIQDKHYEAMIAALIPSGKLGIVSPYTQDTQKLKAIIDQAKGNPGIVQEVESNQKQIVSQLEQLQTEEIPAESIDDLTRTNPVREMNNQILRGALSLAKTFQTQERSRAEFSVKALEAFAAFVSRQSQNDHTVIIYVSGGYNSQPGRRYFDLIDKVVEGRGLNRNAFVYALRTGGSTSQEKFDLYSLLRKSVATLGRYNVTLYTINTRGMAAAVTNTSMSSEFEMQDSKYLPDLQEPLQQIADETGGLFFQNSLNFKLGLDRVLDDLQNQYILCYKPPEPDPKIDYMRIKVVCKKPGVQLRYRKGYSK